MLRLLPVIIVVFLVPFILHGLVHVVSRKESLESYIARAPLMALAAAGSGLVVAVLITFATFSGNEPGTTYHPAAMKDGKIEQGHFE